MAAKLIHITDLYHPHNDPDDHYDLAQVFALHKCGAIDLQHVIIDYPKMDDRWAPALASVYQLNDLTGSNVHVTLGADTRLYVGKPELWKEAPISNTQAAETILKILQTSEEKVFITIVGGCLDTAIALERSPETFREKCAGIILNAGSGIPTVEKEWNVMLGLTEYSKIFEAPCPVYWNPCMHSMECWSGEFGTHYRFLQKKMWQKLSPQLLNYFLYILTHSQNPLFLKVLHETPDPEAVAAYGEMYRDMYCTGSIFDIAGKTVTTDGRIADKETVSNPVFEYRPVKASPTPEGDTIWEYDETSTDRFMFCVNDTACYDNAMAEALGDLLSTL